MPVLLIKIKIWVDRLVWDVSANFYSPFLHYWLVTSLEIINIRNTGNRNHSDLELMVVLVTRISNIDFV